VFSQPHAVIRDNGHERVVQEVEFLEFGDESAHLSVDEFALAQVEGG
jgi:hypothetical protein